MTCPSCHHDRLLHDSWGCKTKCGCGVSIIYLTPTAPLPRKAEPTEEAALIEQGNQIDRDTDKLEESRLRTLYERVASESGRR